MSALAKNYFRTGGPCLVFCSAATTLYSSQSKHPLADDILSDSISKTVCKFQRFLTGWAVSLGFLSVTQLSLCQISKQNRAFFLLSFTLSTHARFKKNLYVKSIKNEKSGPVDESQISEIRCMAGLSYKYPFQGFFHLQLTIACLHDDDKQLTRLAC